MNVLLVEDDVMIGENIQIALEGEGMDVHWVKTGQDADNVLQNRNYDAVLLDLGLPQRDGVEVLRGLRARGSNVPVMVVTARDTLADKVNGLNSGADDYLIKPFDLEELSARLHALMRRVRGHNEQIYKHGDVTINQTTRQAIVGDRQVLLSSREWTVLDALLTRPGAILSRAQLEQRLYGLAGELDSNAVEVFIHGLRKKLGHRFIINVRGVGYMVEKAG